MIAERLPQILLLGALLIDGIFGEVPNRFHPVVWMGKYIGYFWKKRIVKSERSLFLWGALLLFTGIVFFSSIPWCLNRFFPPFAACALSLYMLTTIFSMNALLKAAKVVRKALSEGDLVEARRLTSWHLVSRDTSDLSSEELVSAVVESVSENITDGFTSPLLFFVFGGIPAAWAYRFTNTSDSMIAYRKDDFEWGGKLTAWLDDIFNWVPARLTGLIICLSAYLTGEEGKNSFKIMLSAHQLTSSPNAGWTMAAMAGALNIRLEKKGDYLLDGGREERTLSKIDKAVKIVIGAMMLIVILCFFLLEVLIWLNR